MTTDPSPETRSASRASLGDVFFRGLCHSAGYFVLSVAVALIAVLVIQSWPYLTGSDVNQQLQDPVAALVGSHAKYLISPDAKLLQSAKWNPKRNDFGALVFIYGTLATSIIAMLIAVPLGVGAAAYLSEIAPPRLRRACGFLLELLAAIPSVVYGFWAIEFLARRGTRPFFEFLGLENMAAGQGILAAGLVLAVMVLPYITAVSYDVCQAVPRSQREGALAVGATRWQVIWRIVLPYARPGILAACFLALGRAIGETMAVTMVIGNAQVLPKSVEQFIAGTGDSIPSAIAKQLPETTEPSHRAALVTLGLLLLAITLITNLAARTLIAWFARPRTSVRTVNPDAALEKSMELPSPPVPDPPEVFERARRQAQRWDRIMTVVLAGCQLITVVPLFLILGYITVRGIGGIDLDLFTELPGSTSSPHRGLGHAMLGSVYLVGMASLFAVPVGVLTAVLLAEYRNSRMVAPVRFVAELLGGVPSIVIGVFAYSLLVFPMWSDTTWGFSAWAGAFALGVMMLPVVIRAGEEAMLLVPGGLREASYALGASRAQTVLRVVLPAALPAVITGVLLAVGRVAGETAPLLLTAQGSNYWPQKLSAPTPSLPYYIYTFSTNPHPDDTRLAWAGAFVLIAFVLTLNVATRLVAGTRSVNASRAA